MTWEIAILKAFDGLGDCVLNQEAYVHVQDFRKLDAHHRRLQWGERPAYQNQMRSHISNLCAKGEMRKIGRGLHCITGKGKVRIADL
jgi:hypothetical protein